MNTEDQTSLAGDFWLGDILVRPRDRQFEVAGEVRQIDHKAFQVLGCLVRDGGSAVTKREIFEQVWGQDFVSDEVLTVAISRLRRILGDQARAPRFIETVPHVGYRLIAAVRPEEGGGETPEPESGVLPATSLLPLWGRLLLILSVFLLAGGGLLLLRSFAPAPAKAIRSLAVLPLENLTGEEKEEHIADGMTEALITGLARQQGIRVVSRASVRRYKETRPPLADIARALRVDAVVEGSVQKVGDRLRISARLVEVSRDQHLWARTLDGGLADILDLQEQLVGTMARKLLPVQALVQALVPRGSVVPIDPEAYEHSLRGRYLLGQEGLPRAPDGLESAIREFEAALVLEPNFATAHCGLAEAFLALGERALVPPRQAFPRVRAVAERLLTSGEESAKAHALLAMVLFLYDWQFAAAEKEFLLAIEIDPDEILARDGYSRYLTVQGRFEEALDQQRVLRELNPLIYHQPYLAYIYNMARKHRLALDELHKQLEIEPRSAPLYSHLTSTWRWLGQPLSGRASFREFLRLSGAEAQQVEQIDAAFGAAGVAGVARLLVEHLHQVEEGGGWVSAMQYAEVLTLAGESDAAIEQLEVALVQRDPDLLLLAQSPDYDVLREDPRFEEIRRRVGLPPRGLAWSTAADSSRTAHPLPTLKNSAAAWARESAWP